jgi:hypothetical protein
MYIGLHAKYRYSCQIVMKLEFTGQIFEKYSRIKFHGNPSSRSLSCCMWTDGRTDEQTYRHDEANSRLS